MIMNKRTFSKEERIFPTKLTPAEKYFAWSALGQNLSIKTVILADVDPTLGEIEGILNFYGTGRPTMD